MNKCHTIGHRDDCLNIKYHVSCIEKLADDYGGHE